MGGGSGTQEQQQQRRWNSIFGAIFITFFMLFVVISSASPLSLSEETSQSHLSVGRSLLQAQQGCPVNFENLNYTVITSRCKGPKYPPKTCCDAFKDLACPYADELNDENKNCATTLFSYINLNGKYPPALFASECRDSKRGLECNATQSNPPTISASPPYPFSLSVLSIVTSLPILWHLNLL